MATPSTPSMTPPTRRLALLEARMRASTPAQPVQPPPSTPLTDEDEVRSFSSDASQPRPPANPRRRYGPRTRSRDAVANIAKKRKRASPSVRTARVDSYFKPAPAPGKDRETPLRQGKEADSTSPPGSVAATRRALLFTDAPTSPDEAAGTSPSAPSPSPDGYRHFRARVDRLTAENDALRGKERQAENLRAENEDLRTQLEVEVPDLRDQLATKMGEARTQAARANALAAALGDAVVELAKVERRDARNTVVADSERLGKVVIERSRTSLHEVWEDGEEWKRVDEQLKAVQTDREILERKRKDILKKKAVAQKNQTANQTVSPVKADDGAVDAASKKGEMPPPPSPGRSGVPFEETPEYALEQEELYRVQLQLLKREESSLQEKRVQLVRDRDIMVRELRRQSDERLSTFSDFPVLNERYLLLNLLGRGGFSEVFKALDLERATHVACKIHQLASNWSEEKKRSFIRHAWREYKIHKSLKHPRVVQLVDIFEIDENTFCTVLEYCEGSDLDSYLRLHKTLSEKEAKSIISQVFSGLQYLAEQKRRIIHYDLKPGNILLHKGEVQITDFGLSKVMNETESTTDGMELTSQGAGTMWYLPPECFETASQARISVKVDVWSAGVILFQMLYGRKPFGHDQSQEKMFREKTVAHQELQFPSRPAVSDVAKDFMRRCLTRRASARPDVRQVLLHPFLKRR